MASRTDARGARTPAQWYCTIVGATLVLVGLLGFLADSGFDTGSAVQGDKLVVFEVNGWHNLVHVASGLFLLALAPRRRAARTAALAFGAVYGIVALWGLIDGNDVLGLLPVNGADNVLHVLLAALGLIAGAVSDGDDRRVEPTTGPALGDERAGEIAAGPTDGEARGVERGEPAPAPRRGRMRDEGLRNR
jgi:uncharacterized protein DUF4383